MEILVNFNDIICGGADVLRILRFVFILIDMVCWIVPMGLIVMLMIDFGKNVIAGKEDEMKKNLNIAIKRIIYCIVLFLVPTIVDFAVGLVSNIKDDKDNCLYIARNHDIDLSQYEIDYDTFEPAGNSSNNNEQQDGNVEEVYKCYKCANDNIYIWDNKKPEDSSNGCSINFNSDSSKTTKDTCKAASNKKCYECKDGSGFVLSPSNPGTGFIYNNGKSFNTKSHACGPGFVETSMDNCK